MRHLLGLIVTGKKSLRFGLSYLKKTPVFCGVGKMHLVVDAGPVDPVGGFDAFVTWVWWTVVVVVDDGMVAHLND